MVPQAASPADVYLILKTASVGFCSGSGCGAGTGAGAGDGVGVGFGSSVGGVLDAGVGARVGSIGGIDDAD